MSLTDVDGAGTTGKLMGWGFAAGVAKGTESKRT